MSKLVKQRLQEPSTYAGIGLAIVPILTMFGVHVPDIITQLLMALGGGIAIAAPERTAAQ